MSIYHQILLKKHKITGLILASLGIFVFIAATSHKTNPQIIQVQDSTYKVIIFDLGDVLFTTSSWSKNKLLATTLLQNPMLLYYLINFNTKYEYFTFLHSVPAVNQNKIFYNCKPMPAIMADWQIGIAQGDEITEKIKTHAQTTDHPQAIKNLFIAIATFMFTPQNLAASQQPILSMIRMVQALKNAGYKLFILSNWDERSFAIVQENNSELFDLFDGILISGQAKMAKPSTEFFQLLLQKHNIDPTTAIFIDDEPSNIATAQTLGITSILCKTPTSVTQELSNLGIITFKP